MRKARSMIVEDWRNEPIPLGRDEGDDFKILQVKNSTEWVAGDFLSRAKLDQRIQAGWDITIKPKK